MCHQCDTELLLLDMLYTRHRVSRASLVYEISSEQQFSQSKKMVDKKMPATAGLY